MQYFQLGIYNSFFFFSSEDDRKHVSDHTIKLLTEEIIKEEKKVLAPLPFLTIEFKMYKDLGGQTKYLKKNIVMNLIRIQKYSGIAKWRPEESHAP